MPVTIELTDQEAEFFIAARQANFFEQGGEFVIYREIETGIVRYIKKIVSKKRDEIFIYQRKKRL
jgi:hypothetical protein